MKEFARKLMVPMAKGDEPRFSRRFQYAHQISSNFVVGAKMISTSSFLYYAFSPCMLTCGGLSIQGKSMMSVLHHICLCAGSKSLYPFRKFFALCTTATGLAAILLCTCFFGPILNK
jgi:hypothetical protein